MPRFGMGVKSIPKTRVKTVGLQMTIKRVHCSVKIQYNGLGNDRRCKKGFELYVGFAQYQRAVFEVKNNGNIGTRNKLFRPKRFIEENLELTDKPFVAFIVAKMFNVKHRKVLK